MILRPFRKEDAAIICQWLRTAEELYIWSADRFNKFPLTADDIDRHYALQTGTGRFFPLAATDESDRLLGHFIIRYPREDDDNSVRFGFVIVDPAARGRGLGQEMLRLGLRYAMEKLRAGRVDLGVFSCNDRARRCYEAIGFREYGRQDYTMPIGTWECIDMEMFIE